MADVPAQEYDAWFHNEPPYKDRLHPVTIVALNQSKAIMREDIVRVKSRLPQWQAEVEQLKARGPLPQDVAENCKLTVDGDLAVRTGFGSVDSTPEELPTTGSEFTVTVRVAALEPELPEAGEQTSFLPLFCSSMF
jgi:hypothetical protein